jgi:hypothetical protein
MAGKHLGIDLAQTATAGVFNPPAYPGSSINLAFREGYEARVSGATNPFVNDPASADFPLYGAWQQGRNCTVPPPAYGALAGTRFEVAF